MKKFISVFLCIFLLTGICAQAANLEVNGVHVNSDMLFQDSTAYVPLPSLCEAMNVRYTFDKKTS